VPRRIHENASFFRRHGFLWSAGEDREQK